MFTNAFIFGAAFMLERMQMVPAVVKLKSQDLIYDKIALLQPDRNEELVADLKARTGLDAKRVDVKKIDLSKGTATIVIRYE